MNIFFLYISGFLGQRVSAKTELAYLHLTVDNTSILTITVDVVNLGQVILKINKKIKLYKPIETSTI
jgi:hypothetical protein